MPASSAAAANVRRSSRVVAIGRSARSTWSKIPTFILSYRLGVMSRLAGEAARRSIARTAGIVEAAPPLRLELQQPLGVAARDLDLVLVAKRYAGEPSRSRRLRLE